MKKTLLFTTLFICIAFSLVFAGEVIKGGPLPEKVAPPEKCATCHNVPHIYKELLQSKHKDFKCVDCHLAGTIQRIKYDMKDCTYYRMGYHEKDGNWIEASVNDVCVRCHGAMGRENTAEKCSSCHMAQEGIDKIVMVKDRKAPVSPDNIKETKEVPHKSHTFKHHIKSEMKK